MLNVLMVQADAEMCDECSVFDVMVALELCMICGVVCCGIVRSTRGIVVVIITPLRVIVTFTAHSNLCPLQPARISIAFQMKIGLCTTL